MAPDGAARKTQTMRCWRSDEPWSGRMEPVLTENGEHLEARDGVAWCWSSDVSMLGELTDTGRQVSTRQDDIQLWIFPQSYLQTTYNYGVALRELYIDRWKSCRVKCVLQPDSYYWLLRGRLGFLPDSISDDRTLYFRCVPDFFPAWYPPHFVRSTNMPRTIESLQQIIQGLYPNPKYGIDLVPKILIRYSQNFFFSFRGLTSSQVMVRMRTSWGICLLVSAWNSWTLHSPKVGLLLTVTVPAIRTLNFYISPAAAEAYNPLLEPLDPKLSKYIGGPLRIVCTATILIV